MSPEYADGPLAVGLLALHDRKFFELLIKDPAKALEDAAARGITLADRDRSKIIKLIQAANDTGWKPLDEWDRYKKTGFWGGGWPLAWVEGPADRSSL